MISKETQDKIDALVKDMMDEERRKPSSPYERAITHARVEGMMAVINQRDDIAQHFSQAYYLVTGRSPKWSKDFGYEDALDEIKEHCGIMRAALRKE